VSAEPRAERRARILAIALIAVHAWILFGAAAPSTNPLSPLAPQVKGPTFDEYYYISAGVSYWRTGDFSENREHPPLAKMLTALPVAWAPGVDFPDHWRDLLHFPVQFFYEHNGADQARNVYLARIPVVLLALVVDWVLFVFARRLGGPWAGLAALALAAFDPSCVAAASTANLDFPSAAFSFFALVAAHRAFAEPGPWRTLLAGVAFGAALLTKFTALLLLPALLALALAACLFKRSVRPALILVLLGLAAFTTFAAGYGFETRSLASVKTHTKYMRSQSVLERTAIRKPVEAVFGEERGIPLLTAIKGLDHTLSETGQIGHRGYLLGETTPMAPIVDGDTGRTLNVYRGWKSFYIVVLLQKLPPVSLLLLLIGIAGLFWFPFSWLDRAFFLVFPAVVLLQFTFSNAQLGIKYVLPALLPLFACAGAVAGKLRFAKWICAIAVLGGLLTILDIHPDEAMYSSPLAGGTEHGARVACVGDEWGQDAPALGLFARGLDGVGAALESGDGPELERRLAAFREHHKKDFCVSDENLDATIRAAASAIRNSGVAYRYYGQGEPSAYGYDFDPITPTTRRGLIAVHATNLYRENEEFSWLERFDPNATEGEPMPGIFGFFVKGWWLVRHSPFAKLGRGLYVYYIP
jgi:4-amino-4-deoxy-L-arabinose transferase-like glycosyltransferase